MGNLETYNAVRSVPKEAQKQIGGGRLKGMTDINPMWRIKVLTEQFGMCGVGWKYKIEKMWTEKSTENIIAAFVHINLYIKIDGEWSDGIPGIGGNKFKEEEHKGIYTNDECYKMAMTDALSVACKALGVGADIYWSNDESKYDDRKKEQPVSGGKELEYKCEGCGFEFKDWITKDGIKYTSEDLYNGAIKKCGKALCKKCQEKESVKK